MAYRFIKDGKLDHEPLIAETRSFLDLFLRASRLELRYEIRRGTAGAAGEEAAEQPEILVTFSGRDQELLLQRHAELLQALEYILHRWLRLDPHFYDHVWVDSGDYRALRLEELKLSARVAAEKVAGTRQPFHFNPMSARERRVVHLALKDFPGVETVSEGTGPLRHIVITPTGKN